MGKALKSNRREAKPVQFVNFSRKEAISRDQTRNGFAISNGFIPVFPVPLCGDVPRRVGGMKMPLLPSELNAMVSAGLKYGAIDSFDAEKSLQNEL